MLAEPDGLHATEFPWLEIPLLDQRFELLEFLDNLLLRLLDEDAVPILALCLADKEIRVVLAQFPVLQVRQLPLTLAKGVVALGVLL